MKNKIISGIIAALSLPVYFSLLWAIDQFLLVRIVLVFVMIACMIVSVYKLSKLILDEHFKKHDKRWKQYYLQLYVLSPYYGLEISQLHLSRFPSRCPVGISL